MKNNIMKSYHTFKELADATYSINIFIESKKKVTIDDMIFVIEDKLMTIFKSFYEENIEEKVLSSIDYVVIINKLLEKVNTIKVYVNDIIAFIPIMNGVKNFSLAYSFKKITYV
jgi:hypothetical protein